MGDVALKVTHLTRLFGGVAAVDDVTLEARSGEALGIIGPNGAGKSTFVGLISGALSVSKGEIEIFGERATQLAPDARTRLGVGRTYQIPRPFARMTVLENLQLAAWHAHAGQTASNVRRTCGEVLERTGLADTAHVIAGGLPLLRRKRLELARALALRPRLILLDEIGAGLVESEIRTLIGLIKEIKREMQSMIIIEHVMDVITECCERTAVLAQGKLLTVGATREVLRDPQVAAVYLGTAAKETATDSPASRAETSAAVESESLQQPTHSTGEPLLSISRAAVSYAGVRALRGVELAIAAGQIVALLGANGAGKTTLARAISGIVPLTAGTIRFDGQEIAGATPDRISALGVGHCMEGRRIFSTLSVEENLLLALPRASKEQAARRLQEIYELFPALAERRDKPGTAMSGGQQQMLAIGRALMPQPRFVIFDEISLGLAPVIVDQLYELLPRIRASGAAILLVEQSVQRALQIADYAYVLAHGEIKLEGRPQELIDTPALRALYVGESAA